MPRRSTAERGRPARLGSTRAQRPVSWHGRASLLTWNVARAFRAWTQIVARACQPADPDRGTGVSSVDPDRGTGASPVDHHARDAHATEVQNGARASRPPRQHQSAPYRGTGVPPATAVHVRKRYRVRRFAVLVRRMQFAATCRQGRPSDE